MEHQPNKLEDFESSYRKVPQPNTRVLLAVIVPPSPDARGRDGLTTADDIIIFSVDNGCMTGYLLLFLFCPLTPTTSHYIPTPEASYMNRQKKGNTDDSDDVVILSER